MIFLGAIISGILVISAINPIHSVFFLILLFINGAIMIFGLEAEFLGIILLVIYLGAIAVLFLFVVMMLNLNLLGSSGGIIQYLPIGFIVGILFIIHFIYILEDQFINMDVTSQTYIEWNKIMENTQSIYTFGRVLYTKYYLYFIGGSMLLFVAMVGAIVLTYQSVQIRTQDWIDQLAVRANWH